MTEGGTNLNNNNQITFTITYPGSSASLAVAPNAVTGISYDEGAGPSEPKSIAVIGAELENDVTITAPADFEVCATADGTFANTLTLTQSELLTANVFVRFKSGLGQGFYDETLTVSTGGITSNVSLKGEVYPVLTSGWNWWAPTKPMTIAELETALGTAGVLINSQNDGFARYENGIWTGSLNNIVPGKMYRIQTTAPVSLEAAGAYVATASVIIAPGYTWFGYTGTQPISIVDALIGFTPTPGDKINSQNEGFAIYENGQWTGRLTTLQPGHGYVYMSNASQSQTLIFH